MSESIDIDDEVFEVLKHRAQPFVDTTPNAVLRRLLGLDPDERPSMDAAEKTGKKGARAARGMLLAEQEYERPILRYLDEQGGRAPSREVVEAVGAALADRLTARDTQQLKSGGIRWEKRAAFVRLRLVERGELARNSPRGTWEITDKGRERLRSHDI
ncbi:MAG TPA: winged helix-turn-helix domain-containing protein [Solirubrobacteraceae bacterium]|nr:winged helix-turn-helix domain-containing protein [Solirubrobacteraceae bacterium]